jgi:hypothetical protein
LVINDSILLPDLNNDLKKLIEIEEPDVEAKQETPGTGLIREKRKTDRLTAYACEDSRLNIRYSNR